MQDKTILRTADVVTLLNISKPTLYRWVREGRFPAGVKYGPNTTGWPRHVVDQWLAAKESRATASMQ